MSAKVIPSLVPGPPLAAFFFCSCEKNAVEKIARGGLGTHFFGHIIKAGVETVKEHQKITQG